MAYTPPARNNVELVLPTSYTAPDRDSVILILGEGEQTEKALRFRERMQLIGIKPNAVTYDCLIKGYCDLNRIRGCIEAYC